MLKSVCKTIMAGLFFLFIACLHGIETETPSVSKLPTKDQESLNQFFQYLLYKSPMGYTLFGNKPISVMDYLDPQSCIGFKLEESLLIEKGWETWVRYQAFFPSKEFVLKKEKGFNTTTIIMINKMRALEEISQNLDLFKKKFGQEIQPKELLRQICDTSEPLFEYLGDHALIGILLGFGRKNAVFFSRECEIENYFQARLTPPFSCLKTINQLSPKSQKQLQMSSKLKSFKNESFSSSRCEEEFNFIVNKRAYFELPGDDWFLTCMGPPQFVDYGESPELVDSYVKTRYILRKVYQKGSFLQVTLSRWTNPQFLGEK